MTSPDKAAVDQQTRKIIRLSVEIITTVKTVETIIIIIIIMKVIVPAMIPSLTFVRAA